MNCVGCDASVDLIASWLLIALLFLFIVCNVFRQARREFVRLQVNILKHLRFA